MSLFLLLSMEIEMYYSLGSFEINFKEEVFTTLFELYLFYFINYYTWWYILNIIIANYNILLNNVNKYSKKSDNIFSLFK